jgi:ankyrin repeat protein
MTRPPLVDAAYDGDLARARDLLARGADVNEKTEGGLTALMAATIADHVEIVHALVAAGADLDVQRTPPDATGSRWSALHDAAYAGHGAIARALVEAGAAVDARDQGGRTPLYWAASMGVVDGDREEVVSTLLRGGAVADSVISPSDDTTLLMVAASAGNASIVAELLRAGADPNRRSAHETALHVAFTPAIAALLVEHGADLGARDRHGRTALERAKRSERDELVETLERLERRGSSPT